MDESPIKIDTSTQRVQRSSNRGDPERGRLFVFLISFSLIALEGISLFYKPEPNLLRWGLTGGLIFGLLSRVQLARVLSILLFGGTLVFSLFVTFQHPDPLLIGSTVYLAIGLLTLVKSRDVDAFFSRRT